MFNKIGLIGKIKHLLSALLIASMLFSVAPIKAEAADHVNSDRVIVSLGDSYSSGEGIEPFYGQTEDIKDKVKNQDWLAHRSEKSWPGMLMLDGVKGSMAKHRDDGNWYFAAASGATTADIITSDFYNGLSKKEQKNWKLLEKTYIKLGALPGKEVVSFQLDIFQQLGEKKADYVTVTIGGNDVKFADIVTKMVTGVDYQDIGGFYKRIEKAKTEMQEGGKAYNNICNAYKRIADAAGPQATIIVAGYPKLFDSNRGNAASIDKAIISDNEIACANSAVTTFNESLEKIVNQCKEDGMNICFASVESEFETHGAYSQDPYIKEIILGTQSEDLKTIDVKSAYSMHPNYKGACAYARCVQAKINELEGLSVVKGTIIDATQSTVDNPVPVLNASISVYANGEKTKLDVIHTADTEGTFEFFLPDGVYSFAVEADGYMAHTTTLELTLKDDKIDPNVGNVQELNIQLYPADSSISNEAYSKYLKAAQKTTASGSWSERLSTTADMTLSKGSATTRTQTTLTSDAAISGYSEGDLSKLQISGSASMDAMGQTYAWTMEYSNGTAHYRYTEPVPTTFDLEIDPSFFSFNTITSDMMTNATLSGNQITFVVPGEALTKAGLAAVDQMNGFDNLSYGDADVVVQLSTEGKIDTIAMAFHASMEYQGYDADMDFVINYGFSEYAAPAPAETVSVVPGYYAQEDDPNNLLIIHEVSGSRVTFSVFWYRLWDTGDIEATKSGNSASFRHTEPNMEEIWVEGTLAFSEDTVVLTLTDCISPDVETGEYRFNLIGIIFSDEQLKEISYELGVPENLDTKITQGVPGYWEGGDMYRTSIEVYYNGELIAGASVNSLTGGLAGAIYVYNAASHSVSDSAGAFDMASTFGYSKAWEIHDYVGEDHMVTSLAFQEDGTFYGGTGWYLSDWYACFTGTYSVDDDVLMLRYTLNGEEKLISYQIEWDKHALKQTSEESLVLEHQKGAELPFRESTSLTAESLQSQVALFSKLAEGGYDG